MNTPELAYVALCVDDVQRAVAFFNGALGLPLQQASLHGRSVPMLGVGRTALALFEPGDPFLGPGANKGVHHIAIAAAEPMDTAVRAGLGEASTLSVADGLDGAAQVVLDPQLTCGVRVRLSEAAPRACAGSDAVQRIDHLGVASTSNLAAREVFLERLGLRYESEQTDSEIETRVEYFSSDRYPSVVHAREPQLRGSLRVTFITVGDCELEFLQDLSVSAAADALRHDQPGNTQGDRSAIARFVERAGPGLHHLALKTPDIDAALSSLGAAGHRLVDGGGRPGSRRARIGFVHPHATGGVLLHFVEREELPPD